MTTIPVAASAASSLQAVASASGAASGVPWFENGSLSFELVKGLPTTLVAIFVAYVAWRQFQISNELKRLARAKLNLDLFERRLEVFRATQNFLGNALPKKPQFDPPKGQDHFPDLFPQASFLFGPEVKEYMTTAWSKRRRAIESNLHARATDPALIVEDMKFDSELVIWFFDQSRHGCHGVFAPYLDFGEWR